MILDFFEILLNTGFWAATIRIACPLIFATLGELICERAGVLNLGIEGIMTVGAMVGWTTVYLGAELSSGVICAALIGAIFGLIHAHFTVYLGASQHVTGIGITLLASSLSYFAFRLILPSSTTPPKIDAFQPIHIPILSDIGFLGPILFQHTAFTYFAFLMVPITMWLINKSPFGLAIKMAGENPMALEAQGINVLTIRALAVMLGSALMAVGGAYLTMSAFNAFYFGMINGRGWIAIALVIFASWRPQQALFGALLFAGLDAYQVRAQQLAGAFIPYQFFLMLPYVLSIFAMIIAAKKTRYPKALLIPFRRGERH
ncbi:MAG: ABC transporter permease [Paracoccaceae bacterium]|nr:ABC transporter permease [Paracoccaceae bacterium]